MSMNPNSKKMDWEFKMEGNMVVCKSPDFPEWFRCLPHNIEEAIQAAYERGKRDQASSSVSNRHLNIDWLIQKIEGTKYSKDPKFLHDEETRAYDEALDDVLALLKEEHEN